MPDNSDMIGNYKFAVMLQKALFCRNFRRLNPESLGFIFSHKVACGFVQADYRRRPRVVVEVPSLSSDVG